MLLCDDCQARSLAKAAAWTARGETHAGIWQCPAPSCGWSFTWTSSHADVTRSEIRKIARAQVMDHVRGNDDSEHRRAWPSLLRAEALWPSEVQEL